MMRMQWRNGGWIAPLSLAATTMLALAGAPAAAQQAGGWLAGEAVSETVIGDRVVDAGSIRQTVARRWPTAVCRTPLP